MSIAFKIQQRYELCSGCGTYQSRALLHCEKCGKFLRRRETVIKNGLHVKPRMPESRPRRHMPKVTVYVDSVGHYMCPNCGRDIRSRTVRYGYPHESRCAKCKVIFTVDVNRNSFASADVLNNAESVSDCR